MRLSRFAAAASVLSVVAVGCSAEPQSGAPSSTSNGPSAAPKVASQIDPRWMGLGTNQLWNWELIDREITPRSSSSACARFNRPKHRVSATAAANIPRRLSSPPLRRGKFDAADARSGQPVNVNGREGFFRPYVGVEDAVLTWSYADDAWATVRGSTPDTSELDTMVNLAADLRPTERSPVRLPLSLANVPAALPVSSITAQHGRWPTIVRFDACQPPGYQVPAPECADTTDSLSILIWPDDTVFETFEDDEVPTFHDDAVPISIGGKDGLCNTTSNKAAAQIRPGMVVEFELGGPGGGRRATTNLEDILTGVVWASDPGNEQSWPAVTDWVK